MPNTKIKIEHSLSEIVLSGIKIKNITKRKVTRQFLSSKEGIYLDRPSKPHQQTTIRISDGTTEVIIDFDVLSINIKGGTGNFLKDLLQLTKKGTANG